MPFAALNPDRLALKIEQLVRKLTGGDYLGAAAELGAIAQQYEKAGFPRWAKDLRKLLPEEGR